MSASEQPVALPELQPRRHVAWSGEELRIIERYASECVAVAIRAALADRASRETEDRRDAERLDWIESMIQRNGAVWLMPCGPELRFVQVRHIRDAVENYPTVAGLREAIDAAMKAKP